jgi:hypothetical protein
MEYAEAVYLRERIQQSASASLFAFLADSPTTLSDIPFPWQHPLRSRMSEKNNAELEHARNFSETMHGAALLYNLMVAEKKTDDVRIGDYSTMLASWANNMKTRSEELQEWSQPQFWALIDATGARIGLGTSAFINTWIKEAVGPDPYGLAKSKSIRELIRSREQALKGPLARLGNRGVDSWGGASSSDQLDFRWRRPVKAILSDLYLALGHA